MLGVFPRTLNADDKSSLNNSEKFPQQIQKQVSRISIGFLKCLSNFEYFKEKVQSHSCSISEIVSSERGGYLNV